MKKKKFEARLPDGTYNTWTNDESVYLREWNKILKPLQEMGFTVTNYDPDVVLSVSSGHSTYEPGEMSDQNFDLPLAAAFKFIAAMKKAKRDARQLVVSRR